MLRISIQMFVCKEQTNLDTNAMTEVVKQCCCKNLKINQQNNPAQMA